MSDLQPNIIVDELQCEMTHPKPQNAYLNGGQATRSTSVGRSARNPMSERQATIIPVQQAQSPTLSDFRCTSPQSWTEPQDSVHGITAIAGANSSVALSGLETCFRCRLSISSQYVFALDQKYHTDCFRCHVGIDELTS